ncbi:hypothetical protein ABIB68_006621 [Bradyrhizobium sp. F1.2.2]
MSCVLASSGKAPCIGFVQPDARCDSSPFRHHVCRKCARTHAVGGVCSRSFVSLLPSPAKASCICSPISQTIADPAKESFSYQNWRTSPCPELKISSLTYIGTAKRAPSGQPEAVVRPATSSSIRQGHKAEVGSLKAARRTPSRRKRVGFAPHRQYIRGDAASNEATSVAKLRLAQQGRVVVTPCVFVPSVPVVRSWCRSIELAKVRSGKVLVRRG